MSRRLGLLGPILVLIGAAAAAVGVWWMSTAKSQAGPFLDVVALDGETALAVRGERSSRRAFLELRRFDGQVAWQALIPPYAGRPGAPGLAASSEAASVRVVRDGGAEVFGLSMRNASKIGAFKLAAARPRDPYGHTLPAAVTLTDLRYSFELVGDEPNPRAGHPGEPWAVLAAIDLATGRPQWNVELGGEPVRAAGLVDGAVWVQQGAQLRGFRTRDGAPVPVSVTPPDPAAPVRTLLAEGELRVELERKARQVVVRRGGQEVARHPLPDDVIEPWPYHLAGGRLWLVSPRRVETLVLLPATDATSTTTPPTTPVVVPTPPAAAPAAPPAAPSTSSTP